MFVVKVGGGSDIDQSAFVSDLARHDDWVLVHGGAHDLNALSEKLGRPPRFVTSVSGHESRYTDRETLEMFNMVYAGKVNKRYVELFQQAGVNAVGLTGLDGRLVEGRRKSSLKVVENGRKRVLRGDHSGTIETINVELLTLLHENGYRLVLTPPAVSHEGKAINVDGDRFAAKVAEALGADALLLLSDVPGLMRDLVDPASLIDEIPYDAIDDHIETVAKGRMKKKLLGAKEALDGGVGRVMIGDARGERPVTDALSGAGTTLTREEVPCPQTPS